ncbi:hypothetical protein HanXRQr2_Chr14g0659781 [Helianthus annuus]|uniref:Uncharacterized protein n=1 Tax=Helianthus annuus TaxID=4232 RepID=A0A9K3H9U7_HELAN|nr:hypothetical protein HanXRQr2_Chr14g0659781 [Helianthus annuus]KAJ0841653.1 hypothetical protein HanPSC8_Chr14g0632871 [Helianthus annuus]
MFSSESLPIQINFEIYNLKRHNQPKLQNKCSFQVLQEDTLAMKLFVPTITLPTGAPSPFDKHT